MSNDGNDQIMEIYFCNDAEITGDTPMCRTFDRVSFECVFDALCRRYLHVKAYNQKMTVEREYNNL
ncbi:MAG: hypothetical protein E6R03_18035 [Hyphomicrobiaceae bacterium]|nr:MAG: hypothetical protein E6R03_18035 [Hyphomicrobiaceae bacterium]